MALLAALLAAFLADARDCTRRFRPDPAVFTAESCAAFAERRR
jgi:hypothetical protein